MFFFFSSRRRHTRCALVLEFRRVLFRSYWVEPADAGQAIDSAVLHRILQAGDAVAPRDSDAVSRYVAPRLGTISPWASKAGELLRGAGLAVKRRSEEHTSEVQSLMRIS